MLHERLRALRLEKGLRQKDLLETLELSSARYSQYESGKRVPSLDQLMRIADFYDVTLDYLVGRTDLRNTSVFRTNLGGERLEYETVGGALSPDELFEVRKLLEQHKK